MSTGLKANSDGSAAIQVGGVDAITLTSAGAASFVTSPTSLAGNLAFTGTGNRITGDFSNATIANRVAFQSSTTNGNTSVPFIPNGTGTISGILFYGGTDTTNTNFLQVLSNGTLNAGINGTGTYQPLTFFTGGSETARLSATAKTLILSGGDTTANGTGITFPVTQSASSNANTLDDYEEGSWTPGIRFGGNTTGITYGARSGLFTKIGNMVYATFNIDLSNKGSATGSAQLTGLPFASNGTTRGGGAVTYYHSTPALANCGGLLLLIEAADTNCTLRFYNSSTGLSSDLTNSNFSNNTGYWGVLAYPI